MALPELIVAWQPFFVAAAGAAAVLLGLVFVATSIHWDALLRRDLRKPVPAPRPVESGDAPAPGKAVGG